MIFRTKLTKLTGEIFGVNVKEELRDVRDVVNIKVQEVVIHKVTQTQHRRL